MNLEQLAEAYAMHDNNRVRALSHGETARARREHMMALGHARDAFTQGFSLDELWYAVDNVERAKGGVLR